MWSSACLDFTMEGTLSGTQARALARACRAVPLPCTSSQPNPEVVPSSPARCPTLDCLQDFEPKLGHDGWGTGEQGSLQITHIVTPIL